MNKRLLKVAAYLGSQGFFAEAAQLKKVAGSRGSRGSRGMMSDFNPYAGPNFYGKVTPLDEEGLSDEYFVQVPGHITADELNQVKIKIKNACKTYTFPTIDCKVSGYDTKVIDGEEVGGFKVTISGVSESMDTQTKLERLVDNLGGFEAGYEVHNLNE